MKKLVLIEKMYNKKGDITEEIFHYENIIEDFTFNYNYYRDIPKKHVETTDNGFNVLREDESIFKEFIFKEFILG